MVNKMKYILRILIIIMLNVCVIGAAGRCAKLPSASFAFSAPVAVVSLM